MHQDLTEIADSLNELAESIIASYTKDEPMSDIWGWNFPPLNRYDLASLASNLATKLNNSNIETIDDELLEILQEIPDRILTFKTNSLVYLFNGNGAAATPVYLSLIEYISNAIEPLFSWQKLEDTKAMPTSLNRRLRSIKAELEEILLNKEELQSQIELIQRATEAAETLPTDLESLKVARTKVSKLSSDAAEFFGKIDTFYKNSESLNQLIKDKKSEADKLVAQCEEAYKITTTKGLAGAFDQRANRLSNSMWIWVLGLIIALIVGIVIGAERFAILNEAFNSQIKDTQYIWIQISLSILSLGAPIWFAWVATKQINQRFKLSEDYAFKASVAKAYEGYRKEAARIDKAFESRLFGSTLQRLEEPPLRLVENESHNSPYQELINSPQFAKALQNIPEFRDKLIDLIKEGLKASQSKDKSKNIENQTDREANDKGE